MLGGARPAVLRQGGDGEREGQEDERIARAFEHADGRMSLWMMNGATVTMRLTCTSGSVVEAVICRKVGLESSQFTAARSGQAPGWPSSPAC